MQLKSIIQVLALCQLPFFCSAKTGTIPTTEAKQPRGFFFAENKGQITDQHFKVRHDIDFNIPTPDFGVYVGDGQLHYQFVRVDNAEELIRHQAEVAKDPSKSQQDVLPINTIYRVDVELVGANKNAAIVKDDMQRYYEMYYNEHTPEQGAKVNCYGKITYKDIYPNIDWVLYSKDGEFKYEFVVKPGGDPSVIKLKYAGATTMNITRDGNLKVVTPLGDIEDHAPYSYDGNGNKVASSFELNKDLLTFKVGEYSGTLTIDPTLTWGTYYGGSTTNTDYGYGVVVPSDGANVYLGGYTNGTINISTTGSHQQSLSSGYDGYLVKFDDAGVRQWATYCGGTGSIDYVFSVAMDASGYVYIGGYTNTTSGTAIGTSGTQQPGHGGSTYDGWLAKFNSSGVRQWGTYCGGSSTDYVYGLGCDNAGNVFACGYTQSSNNISTPFAQQPSIYSSPEAFLCKYNSSGLKTWGTYCGGNGTDYGFAVACDASGNPYMVGYTYSTTNIASTSGYITSVNGTGSTAYSDGYLVKYSAAQGTRLWGTYYGGNGNYYDYAYGVAVDDSDNVFLLGYTPAPSGLSTSGAHQSTNGGSNDLVVAKFDSTGSLEWSTYYGGSGAEYSAYGNNIKVDLNNNIYFGGYTTSNNNIASGGIYNSVSTTYDAFFVKLFPDGTRDWGSYYGGNSSDYVYGMAVDMLGNLYVSGATYSSNQIATSGAHRTSINTNGSTSYYDGYVIKVQDCGLPLAPGTITGAVTVCQGNTETYSIAPVTGATAYQWLLPNGWTGTSTTNSISVVPNDTSGTVKVRAGVACGYGPWQTLAVTALSAPGATITPSGPTTFCAGANVTLTANTGTGYTYVWLDGTTTLSTTSNAHVASVSGMYTVEITDAGTGCTSTSATEVVTVNPNPTIVFPSLSPTCTNNATVNLMATPTGGTYTGAGVSGTTLNPLTAGPGIHTVIYTYTDSNTCTSTSNQSITINPAPVINFPSLAPICADNPLTLNMATPPGGTYTGTGVSGGVFDPLVSGTGNFNITYTYTDINNCTASGVQSQHVDPLTAVNFQSVSAQCIDAPVVNLMATPAGGTFTGSGVTGTQFNPGTGAGSYVVHYDYTNGYGCTTHDSEMIVVNPLPVMSFPTLGSICDNTPLTMAATPAGGSYAGPGTNGTSTTLNTTMAGPGMHTITYAYTDANTCSNSISQTVDVHAQPVITSQPYLYIEICAGEALATNVGAVNVSNYQWQHNGVDIAGANSSTYVVPVTTTTNSGNYAVIITGTGACSTTEILSNPTAVLVNANPAINLTPAGDTICSGDTILLNSGLTSGMSYQWKLNGVNITGATNPTYPVAAAGAYKVAVTSMTTGCVATSQDAVIDVNPSPSPAISYNGDTEFCEGGALAITSTDTTSGLSYQWQNGGADINGATSQAYTANATGLYTVIVTNSYNCARTSQEVDVLVNPLPTPSITVLNAFGKMSVDQVYSSYQWNLNGNAISGATSQEYQASQSGNYSVTVTDTNGCSATSQVLNPTSVSGVTGTAGNITLYPNPNTGSFVIDGNLASGDGKVALEIVDATGKLIFHENVIMMGDKLHHQLDISQAAAGAYLIRIVSDSSREVIPFVKR